MLQTFDVNGDTDTYIGGTQGDVIQNCQNFEGGMTIISYVCHTQTGYFNIIYKS